MGTTGISKDYYRRDKKAFVADIKSTNSWESEKFSVKMLDSSLVGNCLWILREYTSKEDSTVERIVILYKLGSDKSSFYYKEMDEDMGPYFYNCPKRIYEASTSKSLYSLKWKEACKNFKLTRKIK